VANALPISRDSLNNGLVVLSYQTDRLPLVEIGWFSYAGSIYDPAGKEGLSNLTNTLLTRGTKTRSAMSISREMEFVAASLSNSTGYEYSALRIRCLKKDLNLALDMLSDVLVNSVFSDSEIARAKNEIINDIRQNNDYPYNIGWDKFNELIYKNHPYAHPIEGDTVSVAKLTRKDIVDFFNTYYTTGNSFMVIAGDFDKVQIENNINYIFSAMKKGKPATQIPMLSAGPFADKPQGYYINRPEVNQSYVFIGHSGIAETSPDYFSTRVMNFVLGGSPLTSHLGDAVREKQGLAYDVRSFFDRRLYGGSFVATTQTSDPKKAIGIMLNEINKIKENGASQDELNRAKTFYVGNFPFNYDVTREKVNLLRDIEIYHKGLDYPDMFKSYVDKVTLNDVNQAAKKYLFPNNYLLVIVTNVPKDSLGLQNIEWLDGK